MTDLELERRLRAWYHADIPRDETAPPELRAQVATIPRTRPTSEHTLGSRRNLTLLVAAALTTALIGGAIALGSGSVRLTAVVPPSPTSDASPAPPPRLTERFDSTLHGISMDYPAGWQVRPASEPWTEGELNFDSPAADVIFDPAYGDRLYFALASQPLGPIPAESQDLVDNAPVLCDGEGGSTGGTDAVDGVKAFFVHRCGGSAVGIATDTRGYLILLVVPDEVPGLRGKNGWGWFDSAVETVDLHQGQAADVTASPSTPSPPTTPPVGAEVAARLDGFLGARVAGEGAQQYLSVPEADIPLLYATSSGAPYERAEFEQVLGYDWPYDSTAFKVRLFAADTVVEQLVFMTVEDGRPGIGYVPDGYGTAVAPTTEDGRPLAAPNDAFDGEVTLYVAHPWVSRSGSGSIKLIPEGPGVAPTTDGGERNGWDRLLIMADPARTGTGCPTGPGPADAQALAESIRSDPDLEATAPVALGAGRAEGLMMDVVRAVGGSAGCDGLLGNGEPSEQGVSFATGGPVRLYLFDAPEGQSMRILGIAIAVPEWRFERAVVSAGAIGVEFHAP
jgi:hypothetical protein